MKYEDVLGACVAKSTWTGAGARVAIIAGAASILVAIITGLFALWDNESRGGDDMVMTNPSGVNIQNKGGNVTVNQNPSAPITLSVRLEKTEYLDRAGDLFCKLGDRHIPPDHQNRCIFDGLPRDGNPQRLEIVSDIWPVGEVLAGWRTLVPGRDPDFAFEPDAPHVDRHFTYPTLTVSKLENGTWRARGSIVNGELYPRNVTFTCSTAASATETSVRIGATGNANVDCAFFSEPPAEMEWRILTEYPEAEWITDYGRCRVEDHPKLTLRSCISVHKPA